MMAKEIMGLVEAIEKWSPQGNAGSFTYIDLSSVDQLSKTITNPQDLLCSNAPSRARQLVRSGDVLVATVRPNLNGVAFVSDQYDGATASTGFCVLRSNPDVLNSRYLYRWVTNRRFVGEMTKLAMGQNYPAVSDSIIKQSQIPIPYPDNPEKSLAEQRRIAGILDKADCIRKQRHESLALADEFLKSTFLEMFGDPANNPKQWDVKPIGKYCTTAKKVNPAQQPDIAFCYIDIGSVDCSTGTIGVAREILGSEAPSRARQKVLAGDVLVATVRPNLRGAAFVPNSLDGQICSTGFSVLRPDGKNINTEYLYSITRNIWFTNILVSMCTGANYPAVRHSDVMRIDIPYPPIDLQNRFAEIVKKQRVMVFRAQAAAEEADNLFNSLVQRAFKGEL